MYCANKDNQILYVTFNQDHGYFCVGKRDGYVVYETSPFQERIRRSTYCFIKLVY